jgi:hypothetical protein
MGFDMPHHKNHNEITNIDEKKNKKSNLSCLIVFRKFSQDPYHLASGPVAPSFANAVSVHYFQQSGCLYPSVTT